ncbi:hypothetical protein POM88_015667 [Heracleum sosnowskyi]|uniref:Flavin-containing monooxygenase n=1 Tax=Heracleum sosnowskyi TaxID=360622 RepID=A0AAD8IKA6_9APIA|nr:hypothetical protein POM88_015667 [Heracleum sosnowskyi]
MASGSSSGRVNLGSKGYDLGNEDILSSYSNLDSLNENYSDHGTISAKPGESLALSLLASILAPVRWGISKYIERYITSKYRLEKFDMVPEHSFLKEVNSCSIVILPEDFYNRVEKGSIKLKKSQEFCFSEEGILFDDEVKSEVVDMVILATGFKYFEKLKDIFVSPTFQSYIGSAAGLYRQAS